MKSSRRCSFSPAAKAVGKSGDGALRSTWFTRSVPAAVLMSGRLRDASKNGAKGQYKGAYLLMKGTESARYHGYRALVASLGLKRDVGHA